MSLTTSARAADLLHGALDTIAEKDGWVRPVRFAPEQLRALGSVRAWHPGSYRQLAACTAGVCLEFETDATRVGLGLRMGQTPRGTRSVIQDVERHTGVSGALHDGVTAVIDGRALPTCLPDEDDLVEIYLEDPGAAPERGLVRLPGMGEPHHVRVWLPCLSPCSGRGRKS